jgi:hypothetical protein
MNRLLWIVAGGILLAGCAAVRWGAPPRVEHLASLTPGVSTKADLLMALGAPRGYGAARFSPEAPPMKLWYYEYVRSNGGDITLDILVVILSKKENDDQTEKYDGHLWFSSHSRLKKDSFGETEGTQ